MEATKGETRKSSNQARIKGHVCELCDLGEVNCMDFSVSLFLHLQNRGWIKYITVKSMGNRACHTTRAQQTLAMVPFRDQIEVKRDALEN